MNGFFQTESCQDAKARPEFDIGEGKAGDDILIGGIIIGLSSDLFELKSIGADIIRVKDILCFFPLIQCRIRLLVKFDQLHTRPSIIFRTCMYLQYYS